MSVGTVAQWLTEMKYFRDAHTAGSAPHSPDTLVSAPIVPTIFARCVVAGRLPFLRLRPIVSGVR